MLVKNNLQIILDSRETKASFNVCSKEPSYRIGTNKVFVETLANIKVLIDGTVIKLDFKRHAF